MDPKDMARVILETVISYVNNVQSSVIKVIDVVIFKEDMVKTFVTSMENTTTKKEKSSWWKQIRVAASQFFNIFTMAGE